MLANLPATFAQVELSPVEMRDGPGRRAALLGTLSVLLPLGPFLGVPAVVYGIRGRVLAAEGRASNRSQATTGLSLGILGTLLWLVVWSVVYGPVPSDKPLPSGSSVEPSEAPYDGPYEYPDEEQPSQTHTVVYEVEATSDATYLDHFTDGEGTYLSEQGVDLPWRKEVQMVGPVADIIYGVSAGLGQPGEITCRIFEDGKLVDTESDSGADAYVTCTASPDWE